MTRALDVAIVLVATSLLLIFALGGIEYEWGLVRIRLRDWLRPLAMLVVLLGARGALGARNLPAEASSDAEAEASLDAKAGATGTWAAAVARGLGPMRG